MMPGGKPRSATNSRVRSLAATGGILLGQDYHFDLTRPGIGLYGGLPFAEARPVVRLSLPVIQVRDVAPGESVGYGCTFTATRPTRIATVSAGYADGLIRAMSEHGPQTKVSRFMVSDAPEAAPEDALEQVMDAIGRSPARAVAVRDRAGVSETVQVVAYATAPAVVAGLPYPEVRILATLYGAALLVVGLATVHGTTLGRAAVAGAIPATLVFGYAFGGLFALEAVTGLELVDTDPPVASATRWV